MNIDIIKNYTSSIKSLIENNNISELLSTLNNNTDLSTFILSNTNNNFIISILSNENILNVDKIFIIKKLLNYNINLNCLNTYNQTPLHLICQKNIFELIPYFINQKNKKDIYGKYPFQYIFDNLFLLKKDDNYNNMKDYNIQFDSLLYESFSNIDYAISFSNLIKEYDTIKNSSIEIFTTIENIIDSKSIIIEKDQWYSFETNEFINKDWKSIEENFWKNIFINIHQNKLYDKKNFKIPVQNINLLNKIRESILLGYLQYSIKMYNNLTNMSFNEISNIINKYDKLLTHKKAVYPRNNIINFEDNYFIKGHNYFVIIPMPNYIGNLTYNNLITNYNYYNYKNWVILKLFVRYNKNTQQIIEHFNKIFPDPEYLHIISNSSFLNWKELYWLLISLPYDNDKCYVSQNVKYFDTKYIEYLYKITENKNDDDYKMFEYDYLIATDSNKAKSLQQNSYKKLYLEKYCDINDTALHNYLSVSNKKEIKYLKISFGFEIILLFDCLVNNEFDKKINELSLNSSYNEEFMKRYYTHKGDEHFTKVYSFKNNIDLNRIKSSAMNMNELLKKFKFNKLNIIENEIFQNDNIIDKFINDKDFTLKDYQWDDDSYEDIFVDFIMSKIKFLCLLKYEKVDIKKLYYSKLNNITYLYENLFNNFEHIIKIIEKDFSIGEKIEYIKEIISPDNHLYSFIIKFIKIDSKINEKYKNYILIFLLMISNLWNLSNSFKQFFFIQKDFNNSILQKLYKKIEIFYNENYKSKSNVKFFNNTQLKDVTDILKTKAVKETVSFLSKNNKNYKIIYYIISNIQSIINIFSNITNSFFILNIVTSIYGNIIDCYLDKSQMFKNNLFDISKKLEIDLDLIEKLNSTEIITLSDILPVFLYIFFNPNIIIDILKQDENILIIFNNAFNTNINLNDIKIISALVDELKVLIYHSSNIYYLNGSFLNIMTYSCAASMKLCTLFFDEIENIKEQKDVVNKYYKLLSNYESILHQHELMLMFNSENIDLHLFLNHLSKINMEKSYIISILMKIYGVHPKRQKIINEILNLKNSFLNEESYNEFLNNILIQQVFYGVFFSECMDLNYINDTFSSYSHFYSNSKLSNIYGFNFHSKKFIIDKVLDTYSKHSIEKDNKLHPFLDISNIYNTDKKIVDIFKTLDGEFKNIGMNLSGQYIVYIDKDNNLKMSHNYGYTFSKINIDLNEIKDLQKLNINIKDDGSIINFFKLDNENLINYEIQNIMHENQLLQKYTINENDFNEKFKMFLQSKNYEIKDDYIKNFLVNTINNYYKHIFLDIFQIMYNIFDKIKLNITNNNPILSNQYYFNNIFTLDTNNNRDDLIPNNNNANNFNIQTNEPHLHLPFQIPIFNNNANNTNSFQYQHIFVNKILEYIEILKKDIDNDTDIFIEFISNGINVNENQNNYYEFILLSYYDFLSFLINYEDNEINDTKINNTNFFNIDKGDNNLHKYTIFSRHLFLKSRDYPFDNNFIINKNHLSNILYKIENENIDNIPNDTTTINNFYNFSNNNNNNRFDDTRINRYKNIIFKNKFINFTEIDFLYNKNNSIQVAVHLSKNNKRLSVDDLSFKDNSRIFTYLIKIFIFNDNEEYQKEVIYLSYIDNEKINNINFSINGQQIIISTTTTILISYDYGKKWDIDYLLHYKYLSKQSKYSDKFLNNIYSANLNSHTNYQYIIAKINGECKILIRNVYNKINKDSISSTNFFSDINNIKFYEYHDIFIPNKLNLLFKKNEFNDIKIVSNIYHNRIIFKFKNSIEFYYDHQFFYKEKIFYNPRKVEDDIYIILKENPDIKNYIVGSRIDISMVCIFKKIENLLIQIDQYSSNFYSELIKNYPEQQKNFIYLYSIYVEEILLITKEIDILLKIINKEKNTFDIQVNNLLTYILNNNSIITNSSFNELKELIDKNIEFMDFTIDVVNKKIYEQYLDVLNKHLGIYNLYHYINKNDYYISRSLIKSNMIIKTFHNFKNTINHFSTIDIIDINDIFISYIKEKSIYNFLENSKNIKSQEFINYYKNINPKINEYLKFIVKNSLFNTIIYKNKFFLKNDSSILNTKEKKIINFKNFLNKEKNNFEYNNIFILFPINNFIISDKWLYLQDLFYLNNNLLKSFIEKFYKYDKNIINHLLPFTIENYNYILYSYLITKYNIIGYNYNSLIKKKN